MSRSRNGKRKPLRTRPRQWSCTWRQSRTARLSRRRTLGWLSRSSSCCLRAPRRKLSTKRGKSSRGDLRAAGNARVSTRRKQTTWRRSRLSSLQPTRSARPGWKRSCRTGPRTPRRCGRSARRRPRPRAAPSTSRSTPAPHRPPRLSEPSGRLAGALVRRDTPQTLSCPQCRVERHGESSHRRFKLVHAGVHATPCHRAASGAGRRAVAFRSWARQLT
mmetsp:Transcript_10804/g.20924  ORF Transcript_10804/g.20924 Transcript_10804/m.20924 type:complete len:218 (-) Transcript_10804:24-677(-)